MRVPSMDSREPPSPEAVLDLKPSPRLKLQIQELLDRNRLGGLTAEDEELWQRYQFLEHLVRIAKTEACLMHNLSPQRDA